MSFFNSIFNVLRFNKSNWKAVALSVFAAMVFWFFNALNKNYTTTISFPLAFDYDRTNYISIRPLPMAVRINVTGIGWNLFRRSAGIKVPALVIPLDRPADVKKIVGSTLPAFFANQLADFQINFVITDTLHLAIEPKASRTLGLAVNTHALSIREGYTLISDITITPDSVHLEGPATLMKGLADPVTLQLSQKNIDEPFNEIIDVKFLNDLLVTRDPPSVSVQFQVDKLVEVADSAMLEVIHAPEAVRAIQHRLLPCKVAIPQSYMGQYQPDSLRAVIDLEDFSRGAKKVLPVLVGLPPYSKVIALDSILIKF